MCGLTLVKNRQTKELWSDQGKTGAIFNELLFKHNLIMLACGDHIITTPSLMITKREIEQMLATVQQCMLEFETIMDKRLAAV